MTPREKRLMALRKTKRIRHREKDEIRKAKEVRRRENEVLRKKKRFTNSPQNPKMQRIPLTGKSVLKYKMELPAIFSSLSHDRKSAVKSAYICLQRERCLLCGCSLYELPTFLVDNPGLMGLCNGALAEQHPFHLHHDHDTGLTLGVAHAECNIISSIYCELK